MVDGRIGVRRCGGRGVIDLVARPKDGDELHFALQWDPNTFLLTPITTEVATSLASAFVDALKAAGRPVSDAALAAELYRRSASRDRRPRADLDAQPGVMLHEPESACTPRRKLPSGIPTLPVKLPISLASTLRPSELYARTTKVSSPL